MGWAAGSFPTVNSIDSENSQTEYSDAFDCLVTRALQKIFVPRE